MPRFLIVACPLKGHLLPLLAVGRALAARGGEVHVYSGDSAGDDVEAAGFGFLPFKRFADPFRRQRERYERSATGKGPDPVADWAAWSDLAPKPRGGGWICNYLESQIEDLRDAVIKTRPDVLICDFMPLTDAAVYFPELFGVPVAAFSAMAACSVAGPDAPPFLLGASLPRPNGVFDRLVDGSVRKLTAWNQDVVGNTLVNGARAAYGLRPLQGSVAEQATRLPLFLVPSTPAFDYDRADLPAAVHYVGPCLPAADGAATLPAWLDCLPAERPLVYISEGTQHVRPPVLLKAAVQAFAEIDAEAVITVGRHRSADSLGTLPANVHVEQWVSLVGLLPRLSAVVTNGGSGTVISALAGGVPLVVVPSDWDQPENARRVEAAGAGIRIPLWQLSAGQLRTAIQAVLSEPSYREAAMSLQEDFKRYGGAELAAELLEGLVVHAV